MTEHDPAFFLRLSKQQAPEILWIGCSDSRVPANQIVDLPPSSHLRSKYEVLSTKYGLSPAEPSQ